MQRRVCVLGAGSWGTAFAKLLSPHFEEVVMWAHSDEVATGINTEHKNPRYLSDSVLDDNISATTSLSDAVIGCKWLVVVIPSSYIRDTIHKAAGFIDDDCKVLILTKGIEANTSMLMSDVVASEIGHPQRIAVLSGPNHAEEIIKGKISASTIAACDLDLARAWQKQVKSKRFRPYISSDVKGTEVCSAAKNVIAIACGAANALDVGDNCLSVLMTRGLAEMGRIVSAVGGDPLTCMGMAGMGDLLATCTSPHSRNRSFGEALMQGVTLSEYEKSTHMVVEGAKAVSSIHELACKQNIEVPITNAVWSMLFEETTAKQAIDSLLSRLPEDEFYDFD